MLLEFGVTKAALMFLFTSSACVCTLTLSKCVLLAGAVDVYTLFCEDGLPLLQIQCHEFSALVQ